MGNLLYWAVVFLVVALVAAVLGFGAVEANPFAYFIGRNLLAKACVGLRNYPGALAQFQEIQCRS
jgi:hypothetical protein